MIRPLLLLIPVLFLTGCTTRVVGFESPIAHDYAPVRWQRLATTVEQPFVAGPGYADAVANDPRTTPEQFQQRLATLPEDARTGRLTQLRVGLRLAEERQGPWQTSTRLQLLYLPDLDIFAHERPVYTTDAPLLDIAVDALPRDSDWLVIEDVPDIPSGAVVVLRLVPGSGADAALLEYGLTPDRIPYGSWRANDTDGNTLRGALLVKTRYERDVSLRGITRDGGRELRSAAGSDPAFTLLYGLGMLGLAGVGVALWWANGGRRDGR